MDEKNFELLMRLQETGYAQLKESITDLKLEIGDLKKKLEALGNFKVQTETRWGMIVGIATLAGGVGTVVAEVVLKIWKSA